MISATCCGFMPPPQKLLKLTCIIPPMNPDYTDEDLVDLGRQALTIEIDGLRAQLPRLGTDFARACRICLDCRGRIVVTGMGNSGHIGGQIPTPLPNPPPP